MIARPLHSLATTSGAFGSVREIKTPIKKGANRLKQWRNRCIQSCCVMLLFTGLFFNAPPYA